MLDYELRPMLAHWHPMLEVWEAQRRDVRSRSGHGSAWEHADELREEIERTRRRLVGHADLLADAAGVPPLTAYPAP